MPELRRAENVLPADPYLTGAYLCVELPPDDAVRRDVATALDGLERDFDFTNEYAGSGPEPTRSLAYLVAVSLTTGDLDDDGLSRADVVVHVAAPEESIVDEYEQSVRRVLPPGAGLRVLRGHWLPLDFTSRLMHNFSYAHRVLQQPGDVTPHAFLLPMSKTATWWEKSWMERHTYLLPRYDTSGQMVAEGHALAAAGGIDHLLRRTYRHPEGAAPVGQYDFLTYFECSDDGVAHFHATVSALRDTGRNPEWAFVREGPLWHGRRCATATDAVVARRA